MMLASHHLGVRGFGQVAQANPQAGTYSDLNCPNSCFLLGNVLDMSILGQECWPCHNVCPAGTVWDTTALACSATPQTTNPVVPTVPQSALDVTLTNLQQTIGTIAPWLIGGLVLILVVPMLLRK